MPVKVPLECRVRCGYLFRHRATAGGCYAPFLAVSRFFREAEPLSVRFCDGKSWGKLTSREVDAFRWARMVRLRRKRVTQ